MKNFYTYSIIAINILAIYFHLWYESYILLYAAAFIIGLLIFAQTVAFAYMGFADETKIDNTKKETTPDSALKFLVNVSQAGFTYYISGSHPFIAGIFAAHIVISIIPNFLRSFK